MTLAHASSPQGPSGRSGRAGRPRLVPLLLLSLALPALGPARALAAPQAQADDAEVPGSKLKPEKRDDDPKAKSPKKGKEKDDEAKADKPEAKADKAENAKDGEQPRRGRPRVQRSAPAPNPDAPADDLNLPPGVAGPGGTALRMRYQGVAPGRGELPPQAPQLPLPDGPQRLTWPGFQLRDGVPTVFLQLSGPVEYQTEDVDGAVVLTLFDTVVPLRNNLNPLRVDQFNTVVQSVRVQRKRAEKRPTAVVTIAVKGPVTHKEEITQAENGFSMLVMRVTPGAEAGAGGGEAPDKGADKADGKAPGNPADKPTDKAPDKPAEKK